MSNILFTVTQGTTVETFVSALAEGKVKFYRVRENETTRHIQYLAEGTEAREVAEWVAEQREDGVTMKAIAAEMHASIPTVRRMINALLLAEEVEGYDAEEVAEILADAASTEEPVVEVAETVTVKATDPAVLAAVLDALKP